MSSIKLNDKNINKLSVNNSNSNEINTNTNKNINIIDNNNTIINTKNSCSQHLKNCQSVKELNDLISCHLCKGYLIDATTIVECLHSFCKTCIINHLESNTPKSRFCPRCDSQIHKTKPKLNIRSDPTLQDIVYKLVPGLYKNEMNRRKEFYSKEPENAIGLSNEERGEMSGERLIFTPEDSIFLSIEYFPQVISHSLLPFSKCLSNGALNCETSNDKNNDSQRRYLRCEGGMRVMQLKKWLRLKYDVKEHNDIEIMYKHDPLFDDYTMIDLAYIYSWRRNGPLCLYYKIIEPQKQTDEILFKTPKIVGKRRHTIKHRHKPNKKQKCVHESNLITTNPVNEPLPPVDSALINKVVTINTIGTNVEITSNHKNNTIVSKKAVNTNKTISNMNNIKITDNVNKTQSQSINKSVPKLTKLSEIVSSVKTNNNCIEINGLKKKTINNSLNDSHKKKSIINNHNNHSITKTIITGTNSNGNNNSNNLSNIIVKNGSNDSQSKLYSNNMNNKIIDYKKVSNTITNTNNSKTTFDNKDIYDFEEKSNSFNIEKSVKYKPKITSKSLQNMPQLIPLSAPDFLFNTFSSKLLPNNKLDINSDLEVALNLSTSSKDKNT